MRLVCFTEQWWGKYVDICFHRKTPTPWPVRTMFLVAEGQELIAGVCIYDTAGPHVFFEHLVTNETAPLRTRHAAVVLMAKEMVSYARTVGKLPHILVRHKGVERILRSAGLVPTGLLSLTCSLEELEGKHDRQEGTQSPHPHRDAPEHPDCSADSANAVPAPPGDAVDGVELHDEVPGGGVGAAGGGSVD